MRYLAEYSTFETTSALNNAIYEHIKRNTYELNETDRITLKAIARYAVKYAGAAHLKAETLAQLIGKSVKTARRALNKLAELEIVKKVATTRKINGGDGANIIVILPLTTNDHAIVSTRQEADKLTESKTEPTKSASEPSNSIKKSQKTNVLETAIPSEALKSALPSEIYSAMARYFEADDIYKYYGILLRAKASVDPAIILEDCATPFVEAWHAVVLKLKHGKIRRVDGYLYEAFRKAAFTIKARLNAPVSLFDRFRKAFE